MENYIIGIHFGLKDLIMEFDSVKLDTQSVQIETFSRVGEEEGLLDSKKGMLIINKEQNKFILSYDIFSLSGKIIGTKKVGNSYRYCAVTDFCKLTIYVVRHEELESTLEAIFE